jgi:hypothetical protein
VHQCIVNLQKILAAHANDRDAAPGDDTRDEAHQADDERQWVLSTKPKQSVSERADSAGAFTALRAEALRSDPSLQAVRFSGAQAASSPLGSSLQRQLDAELGAPPEPDLCDPDVRAVLRMSTEAAKNDAYRVQLIDLAALHGELFLQG